MSNNYIHSAAVMFTVAALTTGGLFCSTASAVDITESKASTVFNYQYTGADLASSFDWGGWPDDTKPTATVEGDHLRYDVATGDGMFTWLNDLLDADGWTVEISLQVTQPGTQDYPGVISGMVSDGSFGEYNFINVGADAVYAGINSDLDMVLAEKNMTDGFHQLRIAQAPAAGRGDTHVWLDGQLVSKSLEGLGNLAIARNWWGKGSGMQTQGECLIEYLCVDTSGGYGPDGWVYEPPGALPEKDSYDFTYGYEMTVDPTTQDLDTNSTNDFNCGGDAAMTVADGKMTYNSENAGGTYCMSTTPGGIWEGKTNPADGYTIEVSLKVNSNAADSDHAFGIFSSSPGNSSTAYLTVGADGQGWGGLDGMNFILGENDNTDDFHVFRIAMHPGEGVFSVWRDDVLIGDMLISGYSYLDEIMYFGDGSGNWGGDVEIDYFRFMPGAYAPDTGVYLPGDANKDGLVDAADAATLAANWLSDTNVGWRQGDFNGDGVVNDLDATLLAANWNQTPAEAAVPEPGCLALVLGVLLSLACIRRMR